MTTPKVPWPDGMVDASHVFDIIAHELGAQPNSPANHRIYDRAFTIEEYVEKARKQGKIKRFVYKDPETGEAKAYGYQKDDLLRIIGQAPAT